MERAGVEKLASERHTLRCVLYDAMIQNVMTLFPCVLFVKFPAVESGSGLDL